MAERFFGAAITISTGRVIPVRLIAEQHILEDVGFIPSFADSVRCIRPEPWMGRAQRSTSSSIYGRRRRLGLKTVAEQNVKCHNEEKEAAMTETDDFSAHDINERARLISHRLYAERVDAQPDLIDRARDFLDRGIASDGGTMGQQLWQSILRRPWPQVRDRMLQDDAEGRLLRSNSPFSRLIGVKDEQLRRSIWRTAKAELCSQRTSDERSAA